MKTYDLIGLGIGPFHLSLAALAKKAQNCSTLFLERKNGFSWHPELMFEDAQMQTSCFKDLVTAADPTSPYSFMNYLVQNGLYYSFLNTGRLVITRKEFEMYCNWAAMVLEESLLFEQDIKSVSFKDQKFAITTSKDTFYSTNISVATGHTPRYPHFVNRDDLSANYLHAKSEVLNKMDLTNKNVVIIGGGQTGLEVFTHALKGKWNSPKSVKLISKRSNLSPLDESSFTNEYFTPNYVDAFYQISDERKAQIVNSQKLASDGNTPTDLRDLYKMLYLNTLNEKGPDFHILPMRECLDIQKNGESYKVTVSNHFINECETFNADVVILATGLEQNIPAFLDPINHLLHKDECKRLRVSRNFSLEWDGPKTNKIYALNFSRHGHGIAEPQTSLMAWRSATIINDLTGENLYKIGNTMRPFVHYTKVGE